jgi:hypothetical protein
VDSAYGAAASAITMKAFWRSRGTAPLIVNLGARRTYNITASHTTDNVQHNFSTIRINPRNLKTKDVTMFWLVRVTAHLDEYGTTVK